MAITREQWDAMTPDEQWAQFQLADAMFDDAAENGFCIRGGVYEEDEQGRLVRRSNNAS